VFEELARQDGAVLVERDGQVFRLTREAVPQVQLAPADDIWANYDPEKMLAALRNSRGVFKDIDTEQLKRDIREARGHDSIGHPGD